VKGKEKEKTAMEETSLRVHLHLDSRDSIYLSVAAKSSAAWRTSA
jgi:hypothetical protein